MIFGSRLALVFAKRKGHFLSRRSTESIRQANKIRLFDQCRRLASKSGIIDDIRETTLESKEDLLAKVSHLSKTGTQPDSKALSDVLLRLSWHLKNNHTTISLPHYGREYTRPQLLVEAISLQETNPRLFFELAKIFPIDNEVLLRDGTRLSYFDLLHRIGDLDAGMLLSCAQLLSQQLEECRLALGSDSGSLNFVDWFSGTPTKRSAELYTRAIHEFPSAPEPLLYLLQLDYSNRYFTLLDGCSYTQEQLVSRFRQLGGDIRQCYVVNPSDLDTAAPFGLRSVNFEDGRVLTQLDIVNLFSTLPEAAGGTEFGFVAPSNTAATTSRDFTVFDRCFKPMPFTDDYRDPSRRASYLWLALAHVCQSSGTATFLDGTKMNQRDLLAQAIAIMHSRRLESPTVPNIEACLEMARLQLLVPPNDERAIVTLSWQNHKQDDILSSSQDPVIVSKQYTASELLLDAIDQLQESQERRPQPKRRHTAIKNLYRTAGLLVSPGMSTEFSPRGSTYSRLELLAKCMRMHPYVGDDFSNVACELPTGMKVPINGSKANHERLLRWGIEYQSSMACVNFVDFMEDRIELDERLELLQRSIKYDSSNPIAWIRLFELLPKSAAEVEVDGARLGREDIKSRALKEGKRFMADPKFPYPLSYRQGDLSVATFARDELRRVLGVS